MITIRMNDAAADALGFPSQDDLRLAGIDAADVQRLLITGGIERNDHGVLFVPGLSFESSDPLHHHVDLTGAECSANSWHLEDHPDVHVTIDDNAVPHIGHDHQIHMLRQGVVLSGIVHALSRRLPDRPPVRCITAANATNGTFRFHQIRPGEDWAAVDDLDRYTNEMIVVIDASPPSETTTNIAPKSRPTRSGTYPD
ncbi:hypothetical protein [Microtetraspora malaysiensis]|uniref:Uncharacterized protein n=1 Tax=Microtetraspora malaysiensis TaxID=161358 RepID=A0ABW6T228_9ACTN